LYHTNTRQLNWQTLDNLIGKDTLFPAYSFNFILCCVIELTYLYKLICISDRSCLNKQFRCYLDTYKLLCISYRSCLNKQLRRYLDKQLISTSVYHDKHLCISCFYKIKIK